MLQTSREEQERWFPESWNWSIDERVAGALGSLGGMAALFLFLSPMPLFLRIWREKTTGRFSGLPYVFALVQCELWGLYALLTPHMTAPLITNVIGVTLEAVYVLLFIAFAGQSRREIATLVLFLSSGAALYCWLALRSYEGPDATKAIGSLAVVFNVVMYAVPLSVMGEVIRTRSVECMPLRLAVASTACTSIWIVFAIYVRNVFVLFPNFLGFLLSATQLILYALYSGPLAASKRDAAAGGGGADPLDTESGLSAGEPLLGVGYADGNDGYAGEPGTVSLSPARPAARGERPATPPAAEGGPAPAASPAPRAGAPAPAALWSPAALAAPREEPPEPAALAVASPEPAPPVAAPVAAAEQVPLISLEGPAEAAPAPAAAVPAAPGPEPAAPPVTSGAEPPPMLPPPPAETPGTAEESSSSAAVSGAGDGGAGGDGEGEEGAPLLCVASGGGASTSAGAGAKGGNKKKKRGGKRK